MLKLSDREIIEHLKNGNTDIFKVFYHDFNKITGFIRQNNGGEEDARDIFHEALIILYEKIIGNEFVIESKLSTYLYSVCKNLWLMQLRKSKSAIFNSIDNELNHANLADFSYLKNEENKETEEKLEIIAQKLNEMGEPCMSILTMFYFKKMSFQLIADKLKYKTEKVVKNQKYRCIQKLKESLPELFFNNLK